MRNVLLFFVLLCFTSYGTAQKLNKDYSFRPQEGGTLYFVFPQKGFKSADKEVTKGLEYDITYLSGKDSATYTFTYSTKNVLTIDSVIILNNEKRAIYTGVASMYYVQPKKNYWQQRAAMQIPYDLLVQIYNTPDSYTLFLKGDRSITYQLKPDQWKKQSKLISRIFEVVKYNK